MWFVIGFHVNLCTFLVTFWSLLISYIRVAALPSCLLPFSFPSPLLLSTPALSTFPLPPLLNLGTWIQPRKNLTNIYVRTCILMCIVYIENQWRSHGGD